MIRVITLSSTVLQAAALQPTIRGFIPRVLALYFVAQYVLHVIVEQYGVQLEWLNIPLFTIGFLYVSKKGHDLVDRDKTLFVGIYSWCLCTILTFTTLFAERPEFSIVRVLITCWLLWTMLVVFSYLYGQTEKKVEWNRYFSKSLVLVLLFAMVGQLFIPAWRYGVDGIRLSGGMNPNGMSFIAFFCAFWFMYGAIKEGRWARLNKIGFALSLIAMLWGMSRSVLLSFAVLSVAYSLSLIATGMMKNIVKRIYFSCVLIVAGYFLYPYLENANWYQDVVQRFTNSGGYDTRMSAWVVMTEYFQKNIWVGGAGWWNVTYILDESHAAADSPHNLYLRLLSESGLIGTVAVLVLPLFVLLALMLSGTFGRSSHTNRKKQLFIACMILAVLVGQFFEDRYLTGFGSFGTGAIVWVMSMGLMNLGKKNI